MQVQESTFTTQFKKCYIQLQQQQPSLYNDH